MTVIDVWINCPSDTVAREISEALVAERLAACTNTFAPIQSAFHWKGKVERETEVPLLIKTRSGLFDKVCGRVEAIHPYETPGVTAMEVQHVNAAFRDWILEETSGART